MEEKEFDYSLDRNIRLQVFVDVLDIINNLGFRRVAIQTEKGGDKK